MGHDLDHSTAVLPLLSRTEGFAMKMIVHGVVRGGRVVPDPPLPEGARVEVRLASLRPDVPAELRAEFEAWGRASDRAMARVEAWLEGEAEQ